MKKRCNNSGDFLYPVHLLSFVLALMIFNHINTTTATVICNTHRFKEQYFRMCPSKIIQGTISFSLKIRNVIKMCSLVVFEVR